MGRLKATDVQGRINDATERIHCALMGLAEGLPDDAMIKLDGCTLYKGDVDGLGIEVTYYDTFKYIKGDSNG